MELKALKLYIAATTILLLSVLNSTAATEYAHFVHYSTNDGMASNRILYIEPDPEGHLWIATDFGVDRFNGKKFKHYQGDGYAELKQEFIHSIKYIGNGKLEACGQNSFLQEYDTKTDSFTNKMPSECVNENVTSVLRTYISADNNRYILTNSSGIFQYDKKKGAYINISKDIKELAHSFVASLYIDQDGRKWVGTLGKVLVFDKNWQHLYSYTSKSRKLGAITHLTPYGNGDLVTTSYSDEIWIFNTKNKKIDEPKVINLPFNNAAGLLLDHGGKLWIATDGDGLWYTTNITSDKPVFTEVIPFNAKNNEIAKIYAMAEDTKGNIWIGTYNSGLWGFMKQQSNLVYFSEQKGFPNVVCTGFCTDKDNNLWVSTDGNGLYQVKGNFQQINRYDLPSKNLISMEKADEKGNIMIGTWGRGALLFNPDNKNCHRIQFGSLGYGIDYLNNTSRLNNGDTWICTSGDGLYRKNHNDWERWTLTGKNDHDNPDIWTKKVVEGKNGTIWILTTNTLWRINGDKKEDLLPSHKQQHTRHPRIVEDAILLANGDLLVATTKGMLHISEDGSRIDSLAYVPQIHFSIVIADNDGKIWAASTNGVMNIDLAAKTCKIIAGNSTASTRYDFFPHSGYNDGKGHLYFGTSSGFFCYNTIGHYEASPISWLSFSDLYINNTRIHPFTSVLENGNISTIKEIELDYDQTNISIDVDLVDFDELNKAQCRYRLIGLHNAWTNMGSDLTISFNHLPKGDYTLEVEAFRTNKKEEASVSLHISVLPPWWEAWWFRLSIFLLVVGYASYSFMQRINRMKDTQRLLSKTVEERTSELKSTLAEKNRLISVVAHDLKNPMFAIVSSLGHWLSKNRHVGDQQQIKPIEDVYNSASLLQNEMQKLLDWVQSDKITTNWSPEPVNVSSVVCNVVSLLGKQAQMKGLTIHTDVTLGKCVLADCRSLEIVIRNLVSNSIKFTPRGGAITIKAAQASDMGMIEVTDNGIGINKDMLKNLLTSGTHNSTEGTEKEKGTGMGIDLCQTYIKRNNGTLRINSKPGFGTTICIQLPLTNQEAEINNTETTVFSKIDEIEFDGSILEGNTILLVDDDELIRHTLSDTLSKYVHTIEGNNGKEGLELARKEQPDIIISDVSMPEMDGLTMGSNLSKGIDTQHIPLLFISANSEEQDKLLGLKSGAVDYITKPFSMTELLFKLANMLNLRQRIQQKLLGQIMEQQAKENNAAENLRSERISAKSEELAPDLKRFMDLLEKHYTNCDLQIDDLAKEMCISQSTLSRRIKSLSGKTPVELLATYRLNKAKGILQDFKQKNEDIPIAEVALKVGFTDPSYFTRRFKDHFGYTPSQIPD